MMSALSQIGGWSVAEMKGVYLTVFVCTSRKYDHASVMICVAGAGRDDVRLERHSEQHDVADHHVLRCDVGVDGVVSSGRTRISDNIFNACERCLSFSPGDGAVENTNIY